LQCQEIRVKMIMAAGGVEFLHQHGLSVVLVKEGIEQEIWKLLVLILPV